MTDYSAFNHLKSRVTEPKMSPDTSRAIILERNNVYVTIAPGELPMAWSVHCSRHYPATGWWRHNEVAALYSSLRQTGFHTVKGTEQVRKLLTPVYLLLVPAYGRSYKTQEEMLEDWNGGKDFKVPPIGPYTSNRDTEVYLKKRYVGVRLSQRGETGTLTVLISF